MVQVLLVARKVVLGHVDAMLSVEGLKIGGALEGDPAAGHDLAGTVEGAELASAQTTLDGQHMTVKFDRFALKVEAEELNERRHAASVVDNKTEQKRALSSSQETGPG